MYYCVRWLRVRLSANVVCLVSRLDAEAFYADMCLASTASNKCWPLNTVSVQVTLSHRGLFARLIGVDWRCLDTITRALIAFPPRPCHHLGLLPWSVGQLVNRHYTLSVTT